MDSVQQSSQAIGEFVEWLSENGMAVCKPVDGLRDVIYLPINESLEQLIARHFGVDLNAVERERRAVLYEFSQSMAAATNATVAK